jgi:hypothetical protein
MQTAQVKTSAHSTLKGLLLAAGALFATTPSFAQTLGSGALQQKHAAIASQLAQSPFKRPLLLDSAEAKNSVVGNAYAVIDAPFATVNAVFKDPARWCDVLMLHLNTKGCATSLNAGAPLLVLHVGKKTPQPLNFSHR